MAKDLSDLLRDGPVLPALTCTSPKQVFSKLAAAMAEQTGVSDRLILKAIMEREKLGSTAVGHGVVLPHARLHEIKEPIGGFARLVNPIEFDAVDDQPCDLIFMLLASDGDGAEHLRALARVARVMRDGDLRSRLRDAETEDAIRSALATPETSAAAL
ncbi:MAG: transcriptional regulator [Ponticaulis sp.]|nr:transcriptional regulator [Ponticaulis sp.]|tara:strand:- start:33065 stop:33538 length:474 start_codon:yes stop_codon:yes gene_type:complete